MIHATPRQPKIDQLELAAVFTRVNNIFELDVAMGNSVRMQMLQRGQNLNRNVHCLKLGECAPHRSVEQVATAKDLGHKVPVFRRLKRLHIRYNVRVTHCAQDIELAKNRWFTLFTLRVGARNDLNSDAGRRVRSDNLRVELSLSLFQRRVQLIHRARSKSVRNVSRGAVSSQCRRMRRFRKNWERCHASLECVCFAWSDAVTASASAPRQRHCFERRRSRRPCRCHRVEALL
mmetsp:Transcript_904/g.2484  ORF Transcript_904/g.2484 Transcript_904/m.2484 type:complete len:233 (+) Transcript_904:977-1675(+)